MFTKYELDQFLIERDIKKLCNLPEFIHVKDFTEDSAIAFRNKMNECVNNSQDIIPIIIDSYGGKVYSLLTMIDAIKTCPKPIATIVTGKAMSCGAILFSFGVNGFRFMASNSHVMIHDISSGQFGKTEEMVANSNQVLKLSEHLFSTMSTNIGKDPNFFKNLLHEKHHAEIYLDAQECVDMGLANYIRIPSFDVKIEIKTEFK